MTGRAAARRYISGRPDRAPEGHHRQHVQRSAPAGPRRARGGAQAAGHVHRVDRHPRADALPVGDHRQLGRRGARRSLHPHRRGPAPRRLGRGPRRRPWHPGRQGAQDRALRGRGGLHQAARRRQVRRRFLQRHRRSARCRLVGRQRALRAARRRGRPLAGHPGDVLPARHPGCLRRRRTPRRRSRPGRGCARASGSRRASPAPGSGSGPTGRSSPRTPRSSTTSSSPGHGRPPSSSPASSWPSATPVAPSRSRRASSTTAASPSTASSSRTTSR